MSEVIRMSELEWKAEGERRFGEISEHFMKWRFVCPSCGNVATVEDFQKFKEQGATPNSATCECIGRYTGAHGAFDAKKFRPCNYAGYDYAGYGLFRISPVRVTTLEGKEVHCFAFADSPQDGAR